jgi:hypothetical protein
MVMQGIVHRNTGHTAADVAAPVPETCDLAVLSAACLLWYRYKLIEEKLQLSEYLQWTFLSCQGPMKVREISGGVLLYRGCQRCCLCCPSVCYWHDCCGRVGLFSEHNCCWSGSSVLV